MKEKRRNKQFPAFGAGDQVVVRGKSKTDPGVMGVGVIRAVLKLTKVAYTVEWEKQKMTGTWLQDELVLVEKSIVLPERKTV